MGAAGAGAAGRRWLLVVFIVLAAVCWLMVAAGWSLVRQQLAPSRYCRPSLPERYRVAEDLDEPLTTVVDMAERDAPAGR